MPSASVPDGSHAAPGAELPDFGALDLLATMVAVVNPAGHCVFVNAAFENVLGLSRKSVLRGSVFDWVVDGPVFRDTVAAVSRNDFSTSRFEAQLRRPTAPGPRGPAPGRPTAIPFPCT
jgi:two-component system nitrogen regulation sensor histidine kinase GlnL